MNAPNFNNSIEITKKAFVLLVGNDERSWRDFANNEHAEWTTYFANGVTLISVHWQRDSVLRARHQRLTRRTKEHE